VKRILVACGTGIATSTVVAKKIEEELGRLGIVVKVDQCKVGEVAARARGYDLVVSTTPVPDVGVPALRTISFLTGVGVEADVEKILVVLTGASQSER
jgi:PTS system galactitol-specific IIB component